MAARKADYNKIQDFELLFKEKYGVLQSYARNIIKDDEEAKDIVGDCFEYIWNHWEELDSKNLSSFMFRFVRNRCIDKTRHFEVEEHYRKAILQEALSYNENIGDEVEDKMKKVNRTIESMPPQMRKAFESCFLRNKSYKEAGEEMGVSINTIKSHIHKALLLLRSNKYSVLIAVLTLLSTLSMILFILHLHF